MKPATLRLCSAVMSGPMSTPSRSPGPTWIAFALSASSRTRGPAAVPTATTALIAMQRSPAEPNAAPVSASAANSRSASGSTTAWFFAPPSACTRLPDRAHVSYTYRAIGVEPTKDTAWIPAWARIASTLSLSPCTTFITPSGSPACDRSSAIRIDAEGTFSEGLSTNVLPHAIATGNIHNGTMTGKLNGVMPAQTPTGCRTLCVSTRVPTFSECSPFRSCGMPHANSTTSMPRCTEPIASGSVLPCSEVTSAASARWFFFSNSRNACMTRARRIGGVSRHAGSACVAACTAASTTAASA